MRIAIVMDGGLIQDIFVDHAAKDLDLECVIVDHDANDSPDFEDPNLRLLEGSYAYVYPIEASTWRELDPEIERAILDRITDDNTDTIPA